MYWSWWSYSTYTEIYIIPKVKVTDAVKLMYLSEVQHLSLKCSAVCGSIYILYYIIYYIYYTILYIYTIYIIAYSREWKLK